jgi:hypothetical protein
MTTRDELAKMLLKADVKPHKHGGKIRVAANPEVPTRTLTASIDAVKACALSLSGDWKEPTPQERKQWEKENRKIIIVCDDPLPKEIELKTVPVQWLVSRCDLYHLVIEPTINTNTFEPEIAFRAKDGWNMKDVTAHLPSWLVPICRERRPEIIEFVHAQRREPRTANQQPESGEQLTEGESCSVCLGTIYTHSPEIQRMCHMVNCPHWKPNCGIGPEWLPKERESMEYRERVRKQHSEN